VHNRDKPERQNGNSGLRLSTLHRVFQHGIKKGSSKMNVKAFALASGLLLGVLLFLATLVEAARGEGHNLILLAVFFIGYSVTYLGSLVALVYGFVSGALIGAAFAWLYNRFARKVGPA
jgi:ascorbate-specific PTS system EIIC-type component UlaA